ncbi:MAG: phosphoribosylformylglycinamidine synthase [Clostridiales bacterium]|nr:phosphoribosylformylglycinamidine synthase [Clostridiales bacterium]
MIYRIFVEKKDNVQARKEAADIKTLLNITTEDFRLVLRYDVEGLSEEELNAAIPSVFSEPPVDDVYLENLEIPAGYKAFAVSYLTGQYDQRADSAAQCVQLLTRKARPLVKCAKIYMAKGVTDEELVAIKKHIINPVESEEVGFEKPETLVRVAVEGAPVVDVDGFIDMSDDEIKAYHKNVGFAMSALDLAFVHDYFKSEKRNPTETELKVIDTYWSDHCRHTTFATELKNVKITSKNEGIKKAYHLYEDLYKELNGARPDKYPCLMDLATIAAKKLKKDGVLDNLDVSEEINACSIEIEAEIDGKKEQYLVMFKNETHNHPTEIEPFGGAATCLGGAIRDPLSGRTYVYQAMRITGASDPREKLEDTLEGKLPQRAITQRAAAGFSSYGNQIGLATGIVDEVYHEGYKAKRLETGFVVGGARKEMVYRETPKAGDVIVLLGGETGRDGCGGATGSSKAHDAHSVETCGAEVQKGNALTERKLQRLFLNKEATRKIKKCNDFGAGGVSVAIGELADGLNIDLDKVPKKYEGLNGTELAISESQERMAVVVDAKDVDAFIALAAEENLAATPVAVVTDTGRMKMFLKGKAIVDISRDFLNTNGVKQEANVEIDDEVTTWFDKKSGLKFAEETKKVLSDLNVCAKKGLSETFDSTIGARTVYMPWGGKTQRTPAIAMAAKICGGETDVCTVSAYGYSPYLMETSPFIGAIYSIVASVSKVVATGAKYSDIRLTLQEFFQRMTGEAKVWGVPASALLGAVSAQIGLGLGAIGGKDSMSGTFESIHVPPTLISFALAPAKASKLITNVLKGGEKLYHIPVPKDENSVPDFEQLKKVYGEVFKNIENGNITFATVVENGGIGAAVIKSALGNAVGVNFAMNANELYSEGYGDLIVSLKDEKAICSCVSKQYVGEVSGNAYVCGNESVSLDGAACAYISPLESVFATVAPAEGKAEDCDYTAGVKYSNIATKIAKPRVFIPVFPGTNCELDTARKFILAGAEVETVVVRNRSAQDIEESVERIVKAIKNANIVAFPGGFSGGDEPDGSGKFIATTFRNPYIAEQLEELLNNRDGLALGICNGFQALIKLGLVPYGHVTEMTANSPTLTFNNISRHVSTVVDVRVASNLSPWLSACKVGEVYKVPVSHGEGKIVAPMAELEKMKANGQIATQYADLNGNATMVSPFNPNGSMWAIEGITSPDGRVLGKMGHSERTGDNLYKNVEGNFDMKIFESGVQYFK